MSDILLGQYHIILEKIASLKVEDIVNNPAKLEMLKQLEETVEKLGKLYNV